MDEDPHATMKEVLGTRFSVESGSDKGLCQEITYLPTAPQYREAGLAVLLRLHDGRCSGYDLLVVRLKERAETHFEVLRRVNISLEKKELAFKECASGLALEICERQAQTKAELGDLIDRMLRIYDLYEPVITRKEFPSSPLEILYPERIEQAGKSIYALARHMRLTEMSFICNSALVKLKSPMPLLVSGAVALRQTFCIRYFPANNQFVLSIVCNEPMTSLSEEHIQDFKHAEIWNNRLAVCNRCDLGTKFLENAVLLATKLLETAVLLQAEYWLTVLDLAEKGLVKCRYVPMYAKPTLQRIIQRETRHEEEERALMALRMPNLADETQIEEMPAHHISIFAPEARITSIFDQFIRLKSAIQYQSLCVSLTLQRISPTSIRIYEGNIVRFIDYYRENGKSFVDIYFYISQLISAVAAIKSAGFTVRNVLKSCFISLEYRRIVLLPVWLGSSFSIVRGEMGSVKEMVFSSMRKYAVFLNAFVSISQICAFQLISPVSNSSKSGENTYLFKANSEEAPNFPLIPTIETLYRNAKSAETNLLPLLQIIKERTVSYTLLLSPKLKSTQEMQLLPSDSSFCDQVLVYRTLAALLELQHMQGCAHLHLSPSLLTAAENFVSLRGFWGNVSEMETIISKGNFDEIEYWDQNIVRYLWWRKQDQSSVEVARKVSKYEGLIDYKADVYSFAMLIYHCICNNQSPFYYCQVEHTVDAFYLKVVKPGLQPMFSSELAKQHPLICYYLRRSWGRPALRPTFTEILGALEKYYRDLAANPSGR